MRYAKGVIIVGTSILGGILSGFSAAKLAKMEEIPFGIIFSIGFALVGMLIQFAINKPKYDDDYDEDEDLEYITDPELIDEKFGDIVDLVIDGGIGGIEPSTVVKCTEDEPEIVRQGKGWLEES